MKDGEAGRGEHGVREGVKEEGRAQRERMKDGEAGRGEHGVREGVKEEGRAQRERHEGWGGR